MHIRHLFGILILLLLLIPSASVFAEEDPFLWSTSMQKKVTKHFTMVEKRAPGEIVSLTVIKLGHDKRRVELSLIPPPETFPPNTEHYVFDFHLSASVSKMGEHMSASFPEGTTPDPHPWVNKAIRAHIKKYYNQKGTWAGQYTLEKILQTRVEYPAPNKVVAHVEYRYDSIPKDKAKAGVDRRTFTFKVDWKIKDMRRAR